MPHEPLVAERERLRAGCSPGGTRLGAPDGGGDDGVQFEIGSVPFAGGSSEEMVNLPF